LWGPWERLFEVVGREDEAGVEDIDSESRRSREAFGNHVG
jgi:hypothetical protein